jgi:hypothetical protein
MLASGVLPNGYVTGDKGDTLTFDDDRRLRDLQRCRPCSGRIYPRSNRTCDARRRSLSAG